MAPTRFAALLQRAVSLQQAGQPDEARKLYQQVLRSEPRNADALHLLGLVLIEQGDAGKGLQLLRRAVAFAPGSVAALNNLAIELCRLGQFDEALAVFDRVLALTGSRPDVEFNRAQALRDSGRCEEALAAFDHLVAANPGQAALLTARAGLLAQLGRHADALAGYEIAAALDPAGSAGLGLTLHALGRYGEALAAFDAALAAGAGGADLLIVRAVTLDALGRREEAGAGFAAALALRPGDPNALFGLGNVHYAHGRFAEALACFDLALAGQPDDPDIMNIRGAAMLALTRYADAADAFAKLLAVRPGYDYALGHLMSARLFCCDWTDHEATSAAIRTAILAGKRAGVPFTSLAHEASAAVQRRCAEIYVADKYPAADPAPAISRHSAARIRIAYLSADFRDHPVSYLMAGVFEQHDRTQFETIAISFSGPGQGDYGQRVQAAFDRFIDASGLSDEQVAARLRDLGADIAIDLMGHTAGSRPGIFARRVAPVQVNYLGYPGTSGAPAMDAIIADPLLIPPGHERFYSEAVIRLPHCFQANDDRRNGTTVSRHAAGLPAEGFVFCCFSNAYKITPAMFAIYMRLLAAVPGSHLWLAIERTDARANLSGAARHAGVDPARLVFADRLAYPAHLARLRLAGLALDTFPFNGGTTVSDALWAGVPVVTLAGEAFASRMAASLLTTAGLPDLVAYSAEEFEDLARSIAQDGARLEALRERLAGARTHSPLFKTRAFCRDLEHAFKALVHAGTPS